MQEENPEFQGGDWSDDAYYALGVNGHFHPSAPMVFPEFSPISKAIKHKLDYSLKVETVPGEYDKWVKRNSWRWKKKKVGWVKR